MMEGFQTWLMVSRYLATRPGDAERGPLVRLHPSDARKRLLEGGERVWVCGPGHPGNRAGRDRSRGEARLRRWSQHPQPRLGEILAEPTRKMGLSTTAIHGGETRPTPDRKGLV